MSLEYTYADFINLHVKDRISLEDAKRQTKTARAILKRINDQPGIILADEVGMGKTFVALAVATSIHFQDSEKRPVVVMVPSSLKEKWPRDFQLFRKRCVKEEFQSMLRYEKAERAEDFLKLLDDPLERRKSIIFLTHGAMSRGLSDGWIKLALIQRALYRRRNTEQLKNALVKSLGKLLRMNFVDRVNPDIWRILLNSHPENWLKILQKNQIDPENDADPDTNDDPVPQAIIDILAEINTTTIFNALNQIPIRKTKYYEARLTNARKVINAELKKIWDQCLSNLKVTLPLLVMDEAHHLKNSYTVLASLFRSIDAEDDSRMLRREGALAKMFERMLFLTATPFQLGHIELCNVLERFTGISWEGATAPTGNLPAFQSNLDNLRSKLDESQIYAINLDKAWNHLKTEDLVVDGRQYLSEDKWWQDFITDPDKGTYTAKQAYEKFLRTKEVMRSTEKQLSKWVIRHSKSRFLQRNSDKIHRRKRIIGREIISEDGSDDPSGIPIKDEALLPFLLSARLTALTPTNRPVFAEGLASSYEAFMQTRLMRREATKSFLTDFEDERIEDTPTTSDSDWYLMELERLLPSRKNIKKIDHPKISSTVQKVVELWLRGEKVLVFCHYIATGKALRNYISSAISNIIIREGARKLKCPIRKVEDELDKIGKRFLSEEMKIRQAVDKELYQIIRDYPKISADENIEQLIDSIRRYLRTPSFLVRYFPLGSPKMDQNTFIQALRTKDASGNSLHELIENFLNFLEHRCEKNERENYIMALSSIQSGGIRGKDIMSSFSTDEIDEVGSNIILLPNVRLVNGSTKQETRQKLMLTFNTPFYPDVMVASSVMAEGVDLHLNCRYIIHHDLCWNPSTLEQRTGRIDRIGAKCEQSFEPIHVYIPFVAETQDEKMYRVVMDRERWFKVIMGENYSLDAQTTERLAERIPIPLAVAEELSFKLSV